MDVLAGVVTPERRDLDATLPGPLRETVGSLDIDAVSAAGASLTLEGEPR